jgi:muramidase (phage lysozyme)
MNENRRAFLDMLAWSEIGPKLLANSDNGYNVLVGGHLFLSYADHPRQLVYLRPGLQSTAAGRYQLLARYFDPYKKLLGLHDFSPAAQDAIAIQQIKERGALDDIDRGDVVGALRLVSNIWASLPGAGYNQHEHKLDDLVSVYNEKLHA